MMLWNSQSLCVAIVLLLSVYYTTGQEAAAAENARPVFVGKNIQETQLSIPPKLRDYERVDLIPIVANTEAIPFLLLRAYNLGTVDGMVDLWMVQSNEITFVDTIRGDARAYAAGSIAYKDDDESSIAFFHVGRGGLWEIDGSTKEVKLVVNGLGNFNYFSVMNGSLYFLTTNRRSMWTSDWTKEGTVMVHDFENTLRFFGVVTDGFVVQHRNSSMYFWDETDRSATPLPEIKIVECGFNDVTSIQGDSGSKGLITANGLWAVGRHPPKLLVEDSFSVRYLGATSSKVMMEVYTGNFSFHVTDGDELGPFRLPWDESQHTWGLGTYGTFGPFANGAYYMFFGGKVLSIDDPDNDNAELVTDLPSNDRLAGFITLLEEDKVLFRGVSKLWEFDASTKEVRLLIDWDEAVYLNSVNRDRRWDFATLLRDGSLVMPMRKTSEWGEKGSLLEFWSIQLNANTDEYNANPAVDENPAINATTTDNPTAAPSTVDGELDIDESNSSRMPLVFAQLGTAILLVVFSGWM